jgi:hypothetical protein
LLLVRPALDGGNDGGDHGNKGHRSHKPEAKSFTVFPPSDPCFQISASNARLAKRGRRNERRLPYPAQLGFLCSKVRKATWAG